MSAHPDEVPELDGWRFVRNHPVAKQVEDYEPGRLRLARYIADDGAFPPGQLAVMRLFYGELPGAESSVPGKVWVIVIRVVEPDYTTPVTGEPTDRVMQCVREFDAWCNDRNRHYIARYAAETRKRRDKLAAERALNETAPVLDQLAHGVRKKHGVKDTVFIG